MTLYHYLDVSLELNSEKEYIITAQNFKNHVILSLDILFGEVGSSITVDLLKYNQSEKRGILRVSEDHFVRLYSSLTLNGLYNNIECAYRVHRTTNNPLNFELDPDSDSDSEE